MSYNEDNLRKYMPHLFANNSSKTVITSKPHSQQQKTNVVTQTLPQQVQQQGEQPVTINYIIEEGPKTSIVREYFRGKLDAIADQNNNNDKLFLQGLEEC